MKRWSDANTIELPNLFHISWNHCHQTEQFLYTQNQLHHPYFQYGSDELPSVPVHFIYTCLLPNPPLSIGRFLVFYYDYFRCCCCCCYFFVLFLSCGHCSSDVCLLCCRSCLPHLCLLSPSFSFFLVLYFNRLLWLCTVSFGFQVKSFHCCVWLPVRLHCISCTFMAKR